MVDSESLLCFQKSRGSRNTSSCVTVQATEAMGIARIRRVSSCVEREGTGLRCRGRREGLGQAMANCIRLSEDAESCSGNPTKSTERSPGYGRASSSCRGSAGTTESPRATARGKHFRTWSQENRGRAKGELKEDTEEEMIRECIFVARTRGPVI